MPAAHILVIDSDRATQQLLAFNLGMAGYRVRCADDAACALPLFAGDCPDLVVIDWSLPESVPKMSGLALLRCLRAQPRTVALPVMMVSARAGEADKVIALESGADDYLTKPFGPREMVARIHALLRRAQCGAARPAHDYGDGTGERGGSLRLDPHTLRVTAGARELALGRVEFKLLDVLMRHPGRIHSRAQLLDQVWGNAVCIEERTVDTHVGRLRSALQPAGWQRRIETVRGSGYRFVGAAA
ncbi:two-component system response regulator [Duganella sp. Leaf126]|uniref:winged helix-turn-helix domain-containing protein n=1 Tax=Duganella sp. Leaf126 TaxID=1736266 RepID=UPI00070103D6|nr:winged helix-turn-helix domain-containing protein [Duganella sp. Leaf126]KQQ46330.1 two-component system response regulator [Duganella sp. Leaf126]